MEMFLVLTTEFITGYNKIFHLNWWTVLMENMMPVSGVSLRVCMCTRCAQCERTLLSCFERIHFGNTGSVNSLMSPGLN